MFSLLEVILMEFYTVKQISALLKTNEETVRRWIRAGKLGATLNSKKGGHIISADSLNEFVKRVPKYSSAITSAVTSSPLAISVILGGMLGGLITLADGNKKVTDKDVEKFLRKEIESRERLLKKKEDQLQKLADEIADERKILEQYQYAVYNLDLGTIAEKMNEERKRK